MTRDPRMTEPLPTVTNRPLDRRHLMKRTREILQHEDKAIEPLALRFALTAFERVTDMDSAREQNGALYLQAEAYRRAADLIEERMKLNEAKKRRAA